MTTKPHPTIAETIKLMQFLHEGQEDRAGLPYWPHPLRVMLRLGPHAHPIAKHIALLHDVTEDCGVTGIWLARRGYSPQVIHGVDLLTHDTERTRRGYEDRILQSGNPWAIAVKLADVFDNMAPGRIDAPGLDVVWVKSRLARYTTLAEKLRVALAVSKQESQWGVGLPIEGDPQPGSILAGYWPPYWEKKVAMVSFALAVQVENDLDEGVFG
jgi:(p)ppGpp synthase/HD superfamily hydrolase